MMQKVYPRFALGLRFAVSPGCDADACWNQVFTRLPAALTVGLSFYTCEPPAGEMHPEQTYLCVISGMGLSRCKTLYAYVSADVFLCAYLAQLHPFVQNNYLERCRNHLFVGQAGVDGTVTGGEVSFGAMRFSGEKIWRPAKRQRCLLALGAGTGRTNAESIRLFARTLGRLYPSCAVMPFPIPDGGRGTAAALLALCGGRFSTCAAHDAVGRRVTACYAVLPDETAVVELPEPAPDDEADAAYAGTCGVAEQMLHALRSGCRSFILALRGGPLPDHGEGLLRTLQSETGEPADTRLSGADCCVYVDDASLRDGLTAVLTVRQDDLLSLALEKARFQSRLRTAECVITDQPEMLADGTVSPLYALCGKKRVHVQPFERPDRSQPVDDETWMAKAEASLKEWDRIYGGKAK